MRSDPKSIIELVASGAISVGQVTEGKFASLGHYVTVDKSKVNKAEADLDKADIEYELVAKTPIQGVEVFAFGSKADRDHAFKLIHKYESVKETNNSMSEEKAKLDSVDRKNLENVVVLLDKALTLVSQIAADKNSTDANLLRQNIHDAMKLARVLSKSR